MKQAQEKPKLAVCLAALAAVLALCGFAPRGTEAAGDAGTRADASPIRIAVAEIAPGGKVSLGEQRLPSGAQCSALLTWTGEGRLTLCRAAADGAALSYVLHNGEETAFEIGAGDNYTISVENKNKTAVKAVSGIIQTGQTTPGGQPGPAAGAQEADGGQTVVYESVGLRHYDGPDAQPYIHDVRTNNTGKKIVATERGMVAFDKDGNPLVIDWNGLDSGSEPAYSFLCDWDSSEIPPHGTEDIRGGWSLDIFGKDANAAKIAHVLYCDKKITFEDGTVWENPGYGAWLSTYEGKKADVSALEGYYPFVQCVAPRAWGMAAANRP